MKSAKKADSESETYSEYGGDYESSFRQWSSPNLEGSAFKNNMPQIKPEVETFARIKVIGVGGSGKNTVNHMINSKVKGVDFVAVNTDAQDLHNSLAKKKIHI